MGEPRGQFEAVRLACEAMGTRFELVLPVGGEPGGVGAGAAGRERVHALAAGEEALAEIRLWHQRLSFFEPSSFLSHVNRRAGGMRASDGEADRSASLESVACDPEFFSLMVLCREVWQRSGGAFDPTVAGMMRAGGFRGEARDPVRIAAARALTGFERVLLREQDRTIAFQAAGMALDLGAVAKGWAIDQAAARLREAGIRSALIHGGTSSVLALGAPPGGEAWPIAVALPGAVPAPGDAGAGVGVGSSPRALLRDCALGVSAPHGRVVVGADGRSHGHVLDPRTGRSVGGAGEGGERGGPMVAAVACGSAALADAWSTALLVDPSLARGGALPGDMETAVASSTPGGEITWAISGPGRVFASVAR